ncbi:uncharacterized protein L969DRAFT_46974 [Mixia osmundae IAM 14324]|uniref:18S rRNA factor 2 n=1 Tax=Mixia osmundae (strain CBS 9802 / IAM 14324 / JCM 22182 / KY 12970) TaxID=764103 RepID=G7E5R6_MIXOS|nr:uncharacterized protein L969DRAFT_46974 [Mixia osmundae IAM 14324]KEI40674.1 hypothetical protein L969DRAFT_46974 [Mixia osmundae IAM 14324]GAA98176.1 hypothetical protein E5Q_04859 [Mixia osmundae IAM 14324]
MAAKRRQTLHNVDLFDLVLADERSQVTPEAVEASADEQANAVVKPLQLDQIAKFNKKVDSTGIIYLSRIPPGMGVSKVKHLLSQYGELGRIYLKRDDKDLKAVPKRKDGKKIKEKHTAHRFVEGWIEFQDKRIARSVADLLNAKPIGGKKASPFKDDIWTMKYLPRFKWGMLSEQIALEASIQSNLLRSHLAQSKRDQSSYLQQVDKAKQIKRRHEKHEQPDLGAPSAPPDDSIDPVDQLANPQPKKARLFKQRPLLSGRTDSSAQGEALDKVLKSIF